MKFCDMPYKRITFEEMEQRYLTMIADLENAKSGEDCMAVIRERYKLYNDMTPMQICYVRHDMNVNDAFYAAEQAYYDEIGPKLSDLYNRMSGLLLASPYRPYLENILGKQAFSIMAEAKIGFDARLIPLAQEENTLTARYNVLTSNGTVQWNGKELKRSLMTPYTQSPEREVRRQAALAVSASWEAERDELEDIFSRLVDNRNRQAKLLGFSDYAKLSFHTMYRIGYGQAEVATFREQVKRYIVPLWVQSEKKRMERLHLSHLYSYDGGISFPEGNPVPAGDTAACLAMTREMYTKMSPETAEFISCLLDNELYDVEIRDGKRGGGYMTFFESYRLPFIFANFDGTSENAYIMCHEGGHAFQGYLKRNEEIRERCSVTSETAETHAMSMEFFTYPYMELFFGERAKDYRQTRCALSAVNVYRTNFSSLFMSSQISHRHSETTSGTGWSRNIFRAKTTAATKIC
jgi:M3 family oligoendopeptidase